MIGNISWKSQDTKIGKTSSQERFPPPAFGERSPVNFGPLSKKAEHVSLDPLKRALSREYISALRWCWPLKFLHALEIHQGLLAHSTNGVEVPQKF